MLRRGSLFPGGREADQGKPGGSGSRILTADFGGVDFSVVWHRSDTEKMREKVVSMWMRTEEM